MKRGHIAWRALPLLLAVVLVGSGVQLAMWFVDGAKLDTAITELVPLDAMGEREANVLANLVDKASSRVVVMVEGESAAAVEGAAMALESALADIDGIAAVDARPDPARLEQLAAALAPWRDRLLSQADRAALRDDPAGTVTAWLNEPPFLRALPAAVDPLGTLGRFLAGAFSARDDIASDGFFYWLTRDDGESHALVMFATVDPAGFGDKGAWGLTSRTGRWFAEIESDHGVDIAASGAVFHEAAARQQARAETTAYGVVAGVFVAGLLAWLFGGLGPVLKALVVVGSALLAGFAAATALFPAPHVLTLVLAVPVIGIAVDYLVHAEVHRRAGGPGPLSKSLLRALMLACASSVLAYAALAFVGIDMLRQVAIVAGVGLVVALSMVIALSRLPAADANDKVGELAASPAITRLAAGTSLAPAVTLTVAAVVVATAALLYATGRVEVVDSPAALTAPDASLAADDARIGRRLGTESMRTVLLIDGDDVEQLLAREADAIEDLAGRFGIRATGLSSLVPPHDIQRENRELVAAAYEAVGSGLGDPSTSQSDTGPMSPADLPPDVRERLPGYEIGAGGAWSTVSLAGVLDREALDNWCDSRPGCAVVDSLDAMSGALQRTHAGLREGLVIAFAVIAAMLWFRYRARGLVAALVLAAALAAGFAVPGAAGLPLTLLGTCGVFLLLGLSIDYMLFMLESRRRRATWLAVCVSAATTLVTFSLLLGSDTPAVRMIASPVVAGLPLALLLLFACQNVLGANNDRDGINRQEQRKP